MKNTVDNSNKGNPDAYLMCRIGNLKAVIHVDDVHEIGGLFDILGCTNLPRTPLLTKYREETIMLIDLREKLDVKNGRCTEDTTVVLCRYIRQDGSRLALVIDETLGVLPGSKVKDKPSLQISESVITPGKKLAVSASNGDVHVLNFDQIDL